MKTAVLNICVEAVVPFFGFFNN